jgi:glycosyltransferase involved in cell wall biosynthesis
MGSAAEQSHADGAARRTAPLTAVVTPVYNGAAFLRETMECVQAQTYPNLVHVVLDNASTDATPEIIAAYAGARVPVLARRNADLLPQIENWNAALTCTPPEAAFVRLLCADDTITPDSIAACVALAQRDAAIAVVAHNHRNGEALDDFGWPAGESVLDGAALARGFFENRMGFFATHTLLRADLLQARTPLFDPGMVGADFEAVLALLPRGKVGLINRPLGWTRVHEASVTSTVMSKRNTHFRDWLTALHRHGPGVFTAAEFTALARRFRRHYVRRLLRWRLRQGREAAAVHAAALAAHGAAMTAPVIADALLDWALVQLGARQAWRGWPN